MTITLEIENYRAFASAIKFQVRPLTLFFGYNSAGKSALLRLLPLLRDSIGSRDQTLNMQSACLRGASFSDLLSKHSSSPSLRIAVESGKSRLEYVIRNLPERRTQVVERFALNLPNDASELNWAADESSLQKYKLISTSGSSEANVNFSGLFVDNNKSNDTTAVGMSIFAANILRREFEDVYWLQALRAVPPRKEVVSDAPGRIAPDGSGITQLLYNKELNGSDVIGAVSAWYEQATGFKIFVERGAFSGREIISYRLATAGQHIELADTGEGIGQVLPIVGLLQLALKKELGANPTLVLEHPELHLHAAAEPALANLLCDVAASGTAKIIAETHSESFLLALQLAIIDGRLKPADVIIYWVRQPTGGSATLSEIEFDETGIPSEGAWPVGVFSEKSDQARSVVLARRKLTDS